MITAQFFGVRCDNPSLPQLHDTISGYLSGSQTGVIFTPNPENLLYARRNFIIRDVYNKADFSLPDGIGLSVVHFLKTGKRLKRYPGVDTAEYLLALAAGNSIKVALFGGKNGAGPQARLELMKRWPSLLCRAFGDNLPFYRDGRGDPKQEAAALRQLREFAPAIIFVALGAPEQEQWVIWNKNVISSARIMMGVGGAFDIWSKRIRRAPKFIRAIGLEWLWRLAQEPRRFARILRAVIVFPFYALR